MQATGTDPATNEKAAAGSDSLRPPLRSLTGSEPGNPPQRGFSAKSCTVVVFSTITTSAMPTS